MTQLTHGLALSLQNIPSGCGLYSMGLGLFLVDPFFFFNDTATTEIYTLSLHDALPISPGCGSRRACARWAVPARRWRPSSPDRKSTRLNSSHLVISYAVFCLKKKKKHKTHT